MLLKFMVKDLMEN